ncbi:hypothetical protein DXG03_004671 [Asterophora parasitica]|uniref:Pheromone receptor n=1 Tax=Asterophora parasitica TaxID=117018 RepID=A0A9P7KB92_9AGAR|nr:hypothetical protein DXG03_004671 [Asterophora parasitica]
MLYYIVQGHRYDIFEDTGCQAALYISIPAVFIVWFPQLLFSVITLIYAALALSHFMRRRLTFAAHLQNSNSALTPNRYFRLIAMSVTEMVWGTTFTAFNLYNNVSPGLRPWTNWDDVHSNFSRVDFFPTASIPPQFLRVMMVFWWTLPVSSIIFFIFFGFGEEAKKEYRKVWVWFKKTILRRSDQPRKGSKIASTGGSTIRPLHLVDLKSSSPQKQYFNTSTAFSSTPSSHTFTASSPTKLEEGESDTYSIASISSYEHSHAHDSPTQPPFHASDHITISNAFDAPRPLTPPGSYPPYPESVHDDPESLPSPGYHRPFSPPSIYPVTQPHPTSPTREPTSGIFVTVHRQASVDHIV